MAKDKPILSFTGTYSYLGNFHRCQVEYEGLVYPTSEHAFQAAKSLSKIERRAIQAATSPGAAKIAGHKVKLRSDWEDIKIGVMCDVITAKFQQNTVLRFALLDTGDAHLEEGNWHGDHFWGTVDGHGENWLGKLLMELRQVLRNQLPREVK